MHDDPDYHGDLVFIARHLTPTEAHLLCGRLSAAGVPAQIADANLVQAHSLLSPALGGASVKVPEDYVGRARAVMAAIQRGDFELADDFDPGDPPAGV
ncbi:MAG: hypothetical protein EPO01_18645 [Aquabacterium sp.]|nr:MAG: hypothetical protein EPO12_11380 [Aquabacterium sp.]TAL15183.1 MAG: hypothetical protein EPO01_18645 [Aquabacterium sp.]